MSETVAGATAVVADAVALPEDGRVEYFREFDFGKLDTSLEALLKAGVHFGHLKSRRHPKMEQFIFTTRKNISIVNLEKTVEQLTDAIHFLEGVRKNGKRILFVGIKKQTHDAVRSLAERLGEAFVVDRWLGGTLTNFSAIRGRAKYLIDTRAKFAAGEFKKYTKLEQQKIGEELEKLERKVGGLKLMPELPGAIVIADAKEAGLVIREAQKMGVPMVAIVDTNADPSVIDYPIPGNDDALSSLRTILGAIGKAIVDVKPPVKAPEAAKTGK
ncbi:MAG: 30S ribosomal protein S2 [Candidatus Moraniibacteriota bacterium]